MTSWVEARALWATAGACVLRRAVLTSRVHAVEGAQAYKTVLVIVGPGAFSCGAGHTSPGALDIDLVLFFPWF